MARNTSPITNDCNMSGIKPAMLDLPYPPIQVKCRNRDYAELLKVDYCGAVSEMSAITQYINNQNRMSCETEGSATNASTRCCCGLSRMKNIIFCCCRH
jgi:bacterioferritin